MFDEYNELVEDFEDEPSDEDGFLSPSGPLGSRTSASLGGKFLGEFESERRARAAISVAMLRYGFFPNVWTVSDHGNHELTVVWPFH